MSNYTNISLRKRLALDLHRQFRHAQAALHELHYLFWECTLRCNLQCQHCGSDCRISNNAPDMPLEHFLQVLDDVSTRHDPGKVMLALTGGETLLREDLEECGRQFTRRGFPWGIVSNGLALTRQRLESLLDAGLLSLTISLDGLEENHNWLRCNRLSYNRALEAITMATRVGGLALDVVTCVNDRNIHELNSLKQVLIQAGIRRWRLTTIFPKGRAAATPDLDLSNAGFISLLEFIRKTRKEGLVRPCYGCEGFLDNFEGDVRDGFFFCRAGINIGSVLADGSISACPSLRGDYIQGSIYRDRFTDVWDNRFMKMRDRSWTKTGDCAQCKVYRWCEGNALHLQDERSGGVLRCHHRMITKGCS